jgi:hypothetical protein
MAGAAASVPVAHSTLPDARPAGTMPYAVSPHPWAVAVHSPGAAPAVYTTHFYAGAYYTGTSKSVQQVSMSMRVPDSTPDTTEFYYVLLSVWDNAGSYDQVGFTNDNGVWGWTYSYTSACAGTYHYNPDQYNLVRGHQYTFTMNISSGGNVVFGVAHSGKYVATLKGHSGGTKFLDQSFYTCSGSSYYDYTDYEEIWSSAQPMPSYDYFFQSNTQNNASVTAWTVMSTPAGGGSVQLNGSKVTVVNENFSMSFANGVDAVKLASTATSFTTNVTIARVSNGSNVTLSFVGSSSVFTVTFTPSSGAPGFTASIGVTIKSPTPHQLYNLTFEGKDKAGAYSYVNLFLTVK